MLNKYNIVNIFRQVYAVSQLVENENNKPDFLNLEYHFSMTEIVI